MTAKAIALRLAGAAVLLVVGVVLMWFGLFGIWSLAFLITPDDKATVVIFLYLFVIVLALGFFVFAFGAAIVVQLLGRAVKAALQ